MGIKYFCFGLVLLGLGGCSFEASITSLSGQPSFLDDTVILNRKNPDYISGEVVTTSNGYQFVGVFGEASEKTKSITGNNWQFEGVFYE